MFPSASRITSSEFRYNFVERFEADAPMMNKLKSRMRTFARKFKTGRAARDNTLLSTSSDVTSSSNLAVELSRLRSANADLRVQLAAFRTLDVQYSSRVSGLEVEKDAMFKDFCKYATAAENKLTDIAETHVAIEDGLRSSLEDIRSSLDEARTEADFYKRHAHELVQELQASRPASRFSDDSSIRGGSSSSASLAETSDSDQSSLSISTEADATLIDHPLIWEGESTLQSAYSMVMKMCDMEAEQAFPPTFQATLSAAPRLAKKMDPKAGPIQMIRERTKVRQARWEEIQL